MRVQLGEEVFVAVPAARARVVAYVLQLGAAAIAERDGASGLPWLAPLLAALRQVDDEHRQSEHRSEPPLSVPGSAIRTDPAAAATSDAPWTHDTVLVPEAQRLTGWSAGYLCRRARRDGLGVKVGGVWHLDRQRVLAVIGSGPPRPEP